MQQIVIPEIHTAVNQVQAAVVQAETEVLQLKETLKAKNKQIRDWKKAIRAINGQGPAPRKKKAEKGA